MTARVVEIFSSLQGEGPYAGVRQVFVRFFDCNMSCAWCDTPAARDRSAGAGEEYTPEQVVRQVTELWENCHSVSLTGGEPLLQAGFIARLLPEFRRAGFPVYLDTNGTLPQALAPLARDLAVIAMDIKLPSSTGDRPYWDEHEEFLRTAVRDGRERVFVKTVISNATHRDEVIRAAELIARVDLDVLWVLQPNAQELAQGVLDRCREYQNTGLKFLANVRVLPQWHKLVGLR